MLRLESKTTRVELGLCAANRILAEAETTLEAVTIIQAKDDGASSKVRRGRSLNTYVRVEPKTENVSLHEHYRVTQGNKQGEISFQSCKLRQS